jgi:hypothetical protein
MVLAERYLVVGFLYFQTVLSSSSAFNMERDWTLFALNSRSVFALTDLANIQKPLLVKLSQLNALLRSAANFGDPLGTR